VNRAVVQATALGIVTVTALAILAIPVAMLAYLAVKALPALDLAFLTSYPSDGLRGGGILPAIYGTACLVTLTALLSLPPGLATAIYLVEFSPDGLVARLIRAALFTLSGIPSVVFGLFGLGVFVLLLGIGSSLLAASLTLALLVLPLIIACAEAALASVPSEWREASLALGCTRMQTIRHLVLPQAAPGLVTGTILAVGRAAGETAPILFTGAAFYLTDLPRTVYDQVMALSYHLYVLSTTVAGASDARKAAVALTLLVLVLTFSSAGVVLRRRYLGERR